MSELPILEIFLRESEAKTQVIFQAKTQAETFLLNRPPAVVQDERKRTHQWVTREFKFDDESKLNVDNRHHDQADNYVTKRREHKGSVRI